MVMSTLNFAVSNFSGSWILHFNNFDDAVECWCTVEDSFYLDTNYPGIPELTKRLTSAGDITEFREVLEKHNKTNKEIDLFWDTEFDRHINRKNKPIDSNPKTVAALNKPRLSDVPPVALFALGAAMSDGADKYGKFNWRDTEASASVFYDAMMRHLTDWYNGEDYADDSKIHHLGHLMASCAIVLDAELHGKLKDNRDKRKPQSISRNPIWKAK